MTTERPPTATLDSGRGWLVTAAAVLSMFTVFGVGYSFGAFFTPMADEFDAGSGQTALVFSITIALSFLLAPLTGRLADRVGPRPVLWLGAASLFIGLLATSRTPNLVLGYVTYGVGTGLAIACGYVPMVATVGGWFDRHRTLAMGVAVAGIGLGTLVGSPVSARLIEALGWRDTFALYAVVGAGLLLVASIPAAFGPAAQPTATPRSLAELLRIDDFRLLYGSSLLVTFGLFVPFVFLAAHAEDRGASPVRAAALVGIIGGASVVGRLGLGALAERVGVIRLYRISISVMALSHLLWLVAGSSYAILVAYAAVLGVGYGGFIALSPAVAAQRFGLEGLGGILGTLYTSAAGGALLGPPAAGLVIDHLGAETAIVAASVLGLGAVAVVWRVGEAEPLSPTAAASTS
ncbi:MAG: MFS transporter [Acidimicrobiales bacterium]